MVLYANGIITWRNNEELNSRLLLFWDNSFSVFRQSFCSQYSDSVINHWSELYIQSYRPSTNK